MPESSSFLFVCLFKWAFWGISVKYQYEKIISVLWLEQLENSWIWLTSNSLPVFLGFTSFLRCYSYYIMNYLHNYFTCILSFRIFCRLIPPLSLNLRSFSHLPAYLFNIPNILLNYLTVKKANKHHTLQ